METVKCKPCAFLRPMDILESDLQMIYNELRKSVREDEISDYEEKLFMRLIWNIAERVFRDSEAVKENGISWSLLTKGRNGE